jgi:hypothetical protein
LEQAEEASRKGSLALRLITQIEGIRFELKHRGQPYTDACCISEYRIRSKRTAVAAASISREYRRAKSLLGAARVGRLRAHCDEINARKAGVPLPGGGAPIASPARDEGTWVYLSLGEDGEWDTKILEAGK